MAAARAHLAAGRREAAEQSFRAALAARADHPQAVLGLAGLLQLKQDWEAALALTDEVLSSRPDHAEAWVARGDTLYNLDRYEAAAEAYLRAQGRAALAFDVRMRLGLVYGAMGRFDLGLEALDAAVALRPDAAEARLRRATLKVQFERFAEAWDDYEQRWRWGQFVDLSRGVVPQGLVAELATGLTAAQLSGKRVLLVGEQGVGDQVMFASMIPDLARTAASVTCVCDARLVGLFAASFPGVLVLPPATARVESEEIDLVVAMGSLGGAFRRARASFSGAQYLQPRPDIVAQWAERLGPRSKRLRVGLSWRGGTAATRGRARSVALAALAPLLDLPDCEFVSLQHGDVAAEVAAVEARRAEPIRRFAPAEIHDFEALAGLVANLDVVVSVQTALVHLCGALGKPCLTLVSQNPEWCYGAAGETMPWYRSVKLLRQPQPGAWGPVIAQAADELRRRLAPDHA